MNDATGERLSSVAWTVTVEVSVAPSWSVTVNVTVYVPGVSKVQVGLVPVAVRLSLVDHAYVSVSPSASDDPLPSNLTVKGACASGADGVTTAVGNWFS